MTIVRGSPVPVVDAMVLLGETGCLPRRLVTLLAGGRIIALAVADVLEVRAIEAGEFDELPPLLGVVSDDAVHAIGVLDSELLVLLEASRLIPEDVARDIEAMRPIS